MEIAVKAYLSDSLSLFANLWPLAWFSGPFILEGLDTIATAKSYTILIMQGAT
jgi:hypothetical protein